MNIASSTTMRPSHPYAVCTLVMKDFHYAVGAAVLAHSIRQHNVAASLICLLTTDLIDPACIPADIRAGCPNLYLADNYCTSPSRDGAGTLPCPQESLTALKLLLNVFHHVVLVSPITFQVPDLFRPDSPKTKGYDGWLPQCFSKLHIFRLTAFTKILFLDADMLCLGNFSDIFALDTPFGTLTDNNLLFSHGEAVSQEALLHSLKTRYGISAACFCITPSLLEFDRAIGRLRQRCADATESKYFETTGSIRGDAELKALNAGPDEQLLGWMYFHGRTADLTAWTTISCLYNCQSFRVPRDVPLHLRAEVRIIHYVTDKPWDKCGRNGKIWPDMKIWFDQLESLIAVTARAGSGGVRVDVGFNDDDKGVLSSLREGNKFMTQGEADKEWPAQRRRPGKYQAPHAGGYKRSH